MSCKSFSAKKCTPQNLHSVTLSRARMTCELPHRASGSTSRKKAEARSEGLQYFQHTPGRRPRAFSEKTLSSSPLFPANLLRNAATSETSPSDSKTVRSTHRGLCSCPVCSGLRGGIRREDVGTGWTLTWARALLPDGCWRQERFQSGWCQLSRLEAAAAMQWGQSWVLNRPPCPAELPIIHTPRLHGDREGLTLSV